MKATDPLTGKPFTKKRVTQRFSNRRNQVRYNNMKATERRRILSRHLNILYRNREILLRLLGDKTERIVTRDFLVGAGYNLTYFTQTGNSGKNPVYGIFEFALIPLNGGQYKILRQHSSPQMDEITFNPTSR